MRLYALLTLLVLVTEPCSACFWMNWINRVKHGGEVKIPPKIQENEVIRDKYKKEGYHLSKIGTRKQWMVDGYGRVRIFRGWNSVQKGFPWYTTEMLNDTKLSFYKDLGFNVVRLGCMWSGFEPEEGQYNVTHIHIMRDIVKRLESHGMYVILDMHQDLMSTKFGNYDGIPIWILNKFPRSPHPYPWPFHAGHFLTWTDGYLSQAMGVAFQYLYDNYAGAMDSMVQFWAKVATTFANSSNILGYELINEPWAGDIYSTPALLEPGNAGRKNLAPAYDKINAAIRKVDKETLLFYEPVTWGVFLNGARSGSGFDEVPGGSDYRNVSVLAYHYYCWLMSDPKQHTPLSYLERTVCDKIAGPDAFAAVQDDLLRTGGSSFLTEFGACEPDGTANSSATVECEFVMSTADKFLASWAYWDHVFFDQDGHVNWNIAKSFARVYARAVSGTPLVMEYKSEDCIFYLKFESDNKIKESTEIVIPKLHYPQGFSVEATKGTKWTFDEKERILKLNLIDRNSDDIGLVEITIRPKT